MTDPMAPLIAHCIEHARECSDPACITAKSGRDLEAVFLRMADEGMALIERWRDVLERYGREVG